MELFAKIVNGSKAPIRDAGVDTGQSRDKSLSLGVKSLGHPKFTSCLFY